MPKKKYFQHFVNRSDGIPEADTRDEETATVDESALEDKPETKKKAKKK